MIARALLTVAAGRPLPSVAVTVDGDAIRLA